MLNGKEVKYRVGEFFGNIRKGTVINAILLFQDDVLNVGLLYHPTVRGECASIEMGRMGKDNIWKSARGDLYINLYGKRGQRELKKLGSVRGWRRKIYHSPR